jgi:hypothetical protein
MGNVLEKAKQEQVIALGRLGWSLRRIEAATGVRRETAGAYLRSAGIALRSPGGWGRKTPAKPANEVITGFLPGVRREHPEWVMIHRAYLTPQEISHAHVHTLPHRDSLRFLVGDRHDPNPP